MAPRPVLAVGAGVVEALGGRAAAEVKAVAGGVHLGDSEASAVFHSRASAVICDHAAGCPQARLCTRLYISARYKSAMAAPPSTMVRQRGHALQALEDRPVPALDALQHRRRRVVEVAGHLHVVLLGDLAIVWPQSHPGAAHYSTVLYGLSLMQYTKRRLDGSAARGCGDRDDALEEVLGAGEDLVAGNHTRLGERLVVVPSDAE